MKATKEMMAEKGIEWQSVVLPDSGIMGQLMMAVLFGDFVSYYLAMLYGVDPTPVDAIVRLKTSLAGSTEGL